MDVVVLGARRKLLMMPCGLNTTPRIVESGYWGRGNEQKSADANWGITEWYKFNPQKVGGPITIVGYIGNDNNNHTFQYHTEGYTWRDWFYFNVGDVEGERVILKTGTNRTIYEISFSVYLPIIDNSYTYVKETGQIFFAGKNTPYYGHKNISELN